MNNRGNLFSRKKLNQKGQAFSTFQLLIAAIVALAILVILLQILHVIPDISDKKMSEEAKNFISRGITSPSDLQTSNGRIAIKNGDTLNAKAIADQSGVVSENQICISKGDFEDSDDFSFTDAEGTILKFNGSQTGIKISVLCDTGSEIENDLQKNGITADWMNTPQCETVSQLSQQACIIALRYA